MNPTASWAKDAALNAGESILSLDRSGAVTKTENKADCNDDYTGKANPTLLQIKAQRVHNNSVQRLMREMIQQDNGNTDSKGAINLVDNINTQ